MPICPVCEKPQDSDEPCPDCAKAIDEGRVVPMLDGAHGGPELQILPPPGKPRSD